MSLFQVPAETPYDLRFSVVGTQVRVHPLFWLMALIFGSGSGSLVDLLIWIPVIFFSILLHELGHTLAMRSYDVDSYIVLHGLGGLAVPLTPQFGQGARRESLTSTQQILISLAGPFAGFFLAGLLVVLTMVMGGAVLPNYIFGFVPLPTLLLPFGGFVVYSTMATLMWVNIFWGFINLLPVYPLDGGQVSRHIFLMVDNYDGVSKSLQLSVFTGAVIAAISLIVLRSTYMALLFGILAMQSYQMLGGNRGRRY